MTTVNIQTLINSISDAKRNADKLASENRFLDNGLAAMFDKISDDLVLQFDAISKIEAKISEEKSAAHAKNMMTIDLDDLSEVCQ